MRVIVPSLIYFPFSAWWKFDYFGRECYGFNYARWKWWNCATVWKEVLYYTWSSFWSVNLVVRIQVSWDQFTLARCSRCKLKNVKVLNDGIDWNSRDNLYWKHDVQRFESVKVILHGNAEFEAMDVILQVRLTWQLWHCWSIGGPCCHFITH